MTDSQSAKPPAHNPHACVCARAPLCAQSTHKQQRLPGGGGGRLMHSRCQHLAVVLVVTSWACALPLLPAASCAQRPASPCVPLHHLLLLLRHPVLLPALLLGVQHLLRCQRCDASHHYCQQGGSLLPAHPGVMTGAHLPCRQQHPRVHCGCAGCCHHRQRRAAVDCRDCDHAHDHDHAVAPCCGCDCGCDVTSRPCCGHASASVSCAACCRCYCRDPARCVGWCWAQLAVGTAHAAAAAAMCQAQSWGARPRCHAAACRHPHQESVSVSACAASRHRWHPCR